MRTLTVSKYDQDNLSTVQSQTAIPVAYVDCWDQSRKMQRISVSQTLFIVSQRRGFEFNLPQNRQLLLIF